MARERDQRTRLRPGLLRIDLVQEELRLRIDPSRDAERVRDPAGPECAEPDIPLEAAVVGERLVDHVPLVDPAAVAPDDGADVVAHHLLELGGGPVALLDPVRQLLVPDERVPAHALAGLPREIHQLVGLLEVELAPLRLDDRPLHRVLGRDRCEACDEELAVCIVLEGMARPRPRPRPASRTRRGRSARCRRGSARSARRRLAAARQRQRGDERHQIAWWGDGRVASARSGTSSSVTSRSAIRIVPPCCSSWVSVPR